MRRLLLLSFALAACSLAERPPGSVNPAEAIARAQRLPAVSATSSSVFFVRTSEGGCDLAAMDRVAGSARRISSLDFCPDRILLADPDALLLTSPERSAWITVDGADVMPDTGVIAAIDRDHYATIRGSTVHLVSQSQEVTLGSAEGLSQFRLLPDASALIAVETSQGGCALVRLTAGGRQHITGTFAEIESFDIAPKSREIVFSALRQNRDVGIVSSDGGDPKWIGTDAADETTVTWAPRGNKVSWVIRSFGGDLVRTVHIPTGFSLLADTGASVRSIAWRPDAETFVFVSSSPASSDRIAEMRYGGEDLTLVVPPAAVAGIALEAWPEAGSTGRLAAPPNPRYGHVYPLVIWVGDDARAWSDARAALWSTGEKGLATTTSLDGTFWKAVTSLTWVDRRRVTVVLADEATATAIPTQLDVTVIAPDKGRNETVVRDGDGTVRLRVAGAGRDVVESVAARTIARQEKRVSAADVKH